MYGEDCAAWPVASVPAVAPVTIELAADYPDRVAGVAYGLVYHYFASKDEVLELYLNRTYFGDGAYGLDAAG